MVFRRLFRRVPNKITFTSPSEEEACWPFEEHPKLEDGDYDDFADYFEEDQVPAIEHVGSYESSSTANSTVLSLKVETGTLVQKVPEEGTMEEISQRDESPAVHTTTSVESQYYSKDELETLLTPRFFEEYSEATEREIRQNQQEKQMRRELIQRELDALIVGATPYLQNNDQEVEAEAIEALGVAANKVAYLKKYYDVASCQFIYVPSVAYAVLNGTLLEEAQKHYFGSKEEFLIVYAGSLGLAIIRNQELTVLQVLGDDNILEEDLVSVTGTTPKETNKLAMKGQILRRGKDFCVGVSPKGEAHEDFHFFTPTNSQPSTAKAAGRKFNARMFCTAIIALIAVNYAIIVSMVFNHAGSPEKLSTPPVVSRPSTKNLSIRAVAMETATTIMPMFLQRADSVVRRVTTSSGPVFQPKRMKQGPIVPNLLY